MAVALLLVHDVDESSDWCDMQILSARAIDSWRNSKNRSSLAINNLAQKTRLFRDGRD